MNITEWIRSKILKFLGIEKLVDNPNNPRLTYINNAEEIKIDEIRANRIWYLGDGNELLNFYTERQANGFSDNPIYNRNKRNYFWSLSSSECDIKRVHSGIPHAIIDTITNVIGYPQIKEPTGKWERIEEENDFKIKLTQQARPLTLAEGFGAWKVNFDKNLTSTPLWEYYDAEFVEYIYKQGILVGIMFKSFYKDQDGKDYILFETRYKANGNSYVEYALFYLDKSNDITPVELTTIPELADLPKEPIIIEGLNMITAVPSRYFYDPLNAKYGRSIYAGKLDLFDDLDQAWSQLSLACKQSGIITWINSDLIERGPNGSIGLPHVYNRQFMQKAGVPDGEGNMNQDVITEQPNIYFDKYAELCRSILDYILTGVLSPATLGIDVAKKDNADAQREKEKITIMTRNNIITSETKMMRQIVELSLIMQEFMDKGIISLDQKEIDIKYNEFANPSEESVLESLVPVLTQGAITPELFIDKVYKDSLSDEAKAKEIEWIKEKMQQDEVDMDSLFGGSDVSGTDNVLPESREDEDSMEEIKE